MTKRLDNVSVYHIDTVCGVYHVILEHLKNDRNGNPRYSAYLSTSRSEMARHYTFSGHYSGDASEAEWIVNHHLKLLGL